jgi:hypothetical protein
MKEVNDIAAAVELIMYGSVDPKVDAAEWLGLWRPYLFAQY